MKKILKTNEYIYSLSDILKLGKHKGKTLKNVIDIEPKYVEWLKNNAKDNFKMDNESKNYLVDRLVINSLNYVKLKIKRKYGNY